MARSLLILGVFVVGCSSAPRSPDVTIETSSESSGTIARSRPTDAPMITFQYTRTTQQRPPLHTLYFNVSLRNPSGEPRWIVIPDTLPHTGEADPAPGGDVAELEIYLLSQSPRATLVRAVGGHYWAVWLPGHGHMTLRDLGIKSWNEDASTIVIETLIAREITFDGAPLASVIGPNARSDSSVETDAPASISDPRAQKFWHPDDDRGAKEVIDVETTVRSEVSVRTNL
ncbi:MAG: hypothetical protein U0271_26935 [Polyangiaceae bacterium]